MVTRTPTRPETADELSMAIIGASNAPLLLLGSDLSIIAASASFYRAFEIEPESAIGRTLSDLGEGEWAQPQLAALLKAASLGQAGGRACEMELHRAGKANRHLILNAEKLDYGNGKYARLLLTITDVTDARQSERVKDDQLRIRGILLQEVEHRVGNSLQIIASILLLGAKGAQSEETRDQLHGAAHRVMSIAEVQRQLAASRLGDVELRAYLSRLCEGLGESMIEDPNQLTVEVTTDDSVASADLSVSLGLIVTELVFNALKHAFPGGRPGKITVDYRSDGSAWSLSVGDNGIGMSAAQRSLRPGLGTTIVEALAKQLDARIAVAETNPGTAISVVHISPAMPNPPARQASHAP